LVQLTVGFINMLPRVHTRHGLYVIGDVGIPSAIDWTTIARYKPISLSIYTLLRKEAGFKPFLEKSL
jgi:hypothetical protein